jgi:L-alanine-DL-glutamate epimerase-like enolase superfamily enzyme
MAATGGALTEYPMRDNVLCRKLVRGVPPLIDGCVSPGAEPGLGVELSPDIVERYAYA